MKDNRLNVEIYREAVDILRIGNRAVKKAQEINRDLNIPNVYDFNGTLYYELPSGELCLRDPYKKASN